MNKNKENNNLGLSKEELELLVNNSNNQELLKAYEDKLQNCDLSKSAIELVNKDNLNAVSRITEGVLNKYKKKASTSYTKYIIVGFLISVTSALIFFETREETKNPSYSFHTPSKAEKNTSMKPKNSVENSNNKLNSDSNTIKKKSYTTTLGDDEKIVQNEEETIPEEGNNIKSSFLAPNKTDSVLHDKGQIIHSKKVDYPNKKTNYKYHKRERKVQGIKVMQAIPNKYKNEFYKTSELVEYQGGDKKLEEVLLKKLKGQIKENDIPQKYSSVVFKFNVSSKGKVREVDVQSLVTPELESKIKKTVIDLSSWNKGKKRIPKDYTVYITFK